MEDVIAGVGGFLKWFPETLASFSDAACGFMVLGVLLAIAGYKIVNKVMD